jgi:folylpolyglutamate synthase/dihydropteroate synthase
VTSIDINPHCATNFPGCAGRWRFVHGDSQDLGTFDKVCNQHYSVLYVDGGHNYVEAMSDLRAYFKLVLNHGLILVHDVLATDNFPGVFRAFSSFSCPRMRSKYVLPGSYGLGVIELL